MSQRPSGSAPPPACSTRRPTVPALEEHLHRSLPCLDHGFVRLVDYMGDDRAVVQAARVSYGAGTRVARKDRQLLRYLMRQGHTSPFEMCEIKLHVKLPLFVARQWIRHRTASVNEISGRYSVLDSEFFVPASGDLARQSSSNRQGRGEPLPPAQAERVMSMLREDALRAHERYRGLLEEFDLARELARMELSLNFYTQWYWKIDLHNLLHFLALRLDPHAQREIRVYAERIADLVRVWVPWTWEAFRDYRAEAVTLSRGAVRALRALLHGEPVDPQALGLTPREWRELRATFHLPPPHLPPPPEGDGTGIPASTDPPTPDDSSAPSG